MGRMLVGWTKIFKAINSNCLGDGFKFFWFFEFFLVIFVVGMGTIDNISGL